MNFFLERHLLNNLQNKNKCNVSKTVIEKELNTQVVLAL
jgi:hypothetical protein